MTDVNSKIARFETFLNETLRSDLRKTYELRDKIYTEQAEYLYDAVRKILLHRAHVLGPPAALPARGAWCA